MNEIQIIQNQLATERLHFAEVATACAAALDTGNLAPGSEFARSCADYFAFAITRIPGLSTSPPAEASAERWRDFLRAFNTQVSKHFAAVDDLLTRNLPVTEWRARSGINADTVVTERTLYTRVKATVP
jgi:hypothetical protein